MKTMVALLTGAMLMMATSAMALPALDPGYSWINAPFWTNTDHTTPPENGNSQFALTFRQADYRSDFGLFSVTGTAENPGAVAEKFKIFNYQQVPTNLMSGPGTKATVLFRNDGSVSLDGINFVAFQKTFGFYFDVHTGGVSDPFADYNYYTYNPFNLPATEAGIDHVLTAYNGLTHEVVIYLDDQLAGSGSSDRDFNDMVVYGNDLAPVPEPGTMMLLGAGFLGLAIYGKRRKNA